MNIREKLALWVEGKVGESINLYVNENDPRKLDVDSYARNLAQDLYVDEEFKKIQTKLLLDSDQMSEFSYDDTEEELTDFDDLNLSTLIADEPAREDLCALKQFLVSLEYYTIDEAMNQDKWSATKKCLQDLLIASDDEEMAMLSLKILNRLLSSSHAPKAVCEGFIILVEVITEQINSINKMTNNIEAEELYGIRDSKVYHLSSERRRIAPEIRIKYLEILLKSVNMAVKAQDNIPAVWIRFNEKRLHELVTSFIGMLSHTFYSERNLLSGLDLVTLVQPLAGWCRHWTHSATTRMLLCQELRKNRKFFQSIIEVVVHFITTHKDKKPRKGSSKKQPVGGETLDDKSTLWVSMWGMSSKAMEYGRFSHCFSVVTYLVQYRAGRALFPLNTVSRRRPWTAQDIVALMIDYIEHVHSDEVEIHTAAYLHHLLQMAHILLEVEEKINTARGTQRRLL